MDTSGPTPAGPSLLRQSAAQFKQRSCPSMPDITAIGEVLIDLTQFGVNEQGVGLFAANPGGGLPANVAVAAAPPWGPLPPLWARWEQTALATVWSPHWSAAAWTPPVSGAVSGPPLWLRSPSPLPGSGPSAFSAALTRTWRRRRCPRTCWPAPASSTSAR